MAKKPDQKNYIYCAEHDIFFNKGLEKEAKDYHIGIPACPMCKQKIALMVLSLGASSERSQRERLMDEPHFRHAGGKQKQYIWLKKTPPATTAKARAKKSARG